MSGIVFILFLIFNVAHADADERKDGRSRGAFVAMKRSYWADQQEEAADRRRKKYRLGAVANKDSGGASKRQLTPVKTSMLEDKVRLSYEPVVYRPEKNLDLALPAEKIQLKTDIRHHEYIAHQPLKPLYLAKAE